MFYTRLFVLIVILETCVFVDKCVCLCYTEIDKRNKYMKDIFSFLIEDERFLEYYDAIKQKVEPTIKIEQQSIQAMMEVFHVLFKDLAIKNGIKIPNDYTDDDLNASIKSLLKHKGFVEAMKDIYDIDVMEIAPYLGRRHSKSHGVKKYSREEAESDEYKKFDLTSVSVESRKDLFRYLYSSMVKYYTETTGERPKTRWSESYFNDLIQEDVSRGMLKEVQDRLVSVYAEKNRIARSHSDELKMLNAEKNAIAKSFEKEIAKRTQQAEKITKEYEKKLQDKENEKFALSKEHEEVVHEMKEVNAHMKEENDQLKQVISKLKEEKLKLSKPEELKYKKPSSPIKRTIPQATVQKIDVKINKSNIIRNFKESNVLKLVDNVVEMPININLEIIDDYLKKGWFKEAGVEIDELADGGCGEFYFYKYKLACRMHDSSITDNLVEYMRNSLLKASSKEFASMVLDYCQDVYLNHTMYFDTFVGLFDLLMSYGRNPYESISKKMYNRLILEMKNSEVSRKLMLESIDTYAGYLSDEKVYSDFIIEIIRLLIQNRRFGAAKVINDRAIQENGVFDIVAYNALMIESHSEDMNEFYNNMFETDYSKPLLVLLNVMKNATSQGKEIGDISKQILVSIRAKKYSGIMPYLEVLAGYDFVGKEHFRDSAIDVLKVNADEKNDDYVEILNYIVKYFYNDDKEYIEVCLVLSGTFLVKGCYYLSKRFARKVLKIHEDNFLALRNYIKAELFRLVLDGEQKNYALAMFDKKKFIKLLEITEPKQRNEVVTYFINCCYTLLEHKVNASNLFQYLIAYLNDDKLFSLQIFDFAVALRKNKFFKSAIPFLSKCVELFKTDEDVYFELLLCEKKCTSEEYLCKTRQNLLDNSYMKLCLTYSKLNKHTKKYEHYLQFVEKQKDCKKKRKKRAFIWSIVAVILAGIMMASIWPIVINYRNAHYIKFVKNDTGYSAYVEHSKYKEKEMIIPREYNGMPVTKIIHNGNYYGENNFVDRVVIPNTVTEIGKDAFYSFVGLDAIEFEQGSNLTIIGDWGFYNCGIENIELPLTLKYLGTGAFEKCASLEEIVFPYGLEEIGNNVFRNCYKLNYNNFHELDQFTAIPQDLFANCDLSSVIINENIVEIESGAFKNNAITRIDFLTEDELSDLCIIGNSAFEDNDLTSLSLPNGANIGSWAFANNNLTSIVIPDGVTTIGGYAFKDNKLTSVSIPLSVQEVGWQAFFGSSGLVDVRIECAQTAFDDNYWATFGYDKDTTDNYWNINVNTEVYVSGVFYDDYYVKWDNLRSWLYKIEY